MITVDFHHVGCARVTHYADHDPSPFVTVSAHAAHGNRVGLFFSATDTGTALDAAETWLRDALDQVQAAKIAHANAQQEPLPLVEPAEPIVFTAEYIDRGPRQVQS